MIKKQRGRHADMKMPFLECGENGSIASYLKGAIVTSVSVIIRRL